MCGLIYSGRDLHTRVPYDKLISGRKFIEMFACFNSQYMYIYMCACIYAYIYAIIYVHIYI